MNTLDRAKYRGKCAETGKWCAGSLNHFEDSVTINICRVINADIGQPENIQVEMDVIPETVGQFTGLTDKNGVEHFEGNLYKGFDGVYALEWSNDDGMYWLSNVHRVSGGQATAGLLENFELIGNVHDNPELLEVVSNG